MCVKGYLAAEVKVGADSLHVVTAHLDSKKKPKGVQDLQARQIRQEVLADLSTAGV